MNPTIEKGVRDKAREWLESGELKYVIGYDKGKYSARARPTFIYKAEDADRLVVDPTCVNNLSLYLVDEVQYKPARGEKPDTRPVGIVVKPCDSKTVVELIKENIVPRERVKIIGFTCRGTVSQEKLDEYLTDLPDWENAGTEFVLDSENLSVSAGGRTKTVPASDVLAGKCLICTHHNPLIADEVFGDPVEDPPSVDFGDTHDLEAMSPEERWNFWSKELSRCVRCYACRDACPLCYCKQCVFDKFKPFKWNEKSAKLRENLYYQMVRAMHLAGRCVDCGACERSCPMGIPIRKINRFLLKRAWDRFKTEPGVNIDDLRMFSSYDVDDPQEEIL
ncbi:MAG: 4Fe-4S dicluster domain-containing protein [Candidatus Thermoplasmatota archaeon]|jgi:ferredoxin|nr:4Fe-4S dicluster domain-containing protein [Candidatus Thermoplasmatota archaeon]